MGSSWIGHFTQLNASSCNRDQIIKDAQNITHPRVEMTINNVFKTTEYTVPTCSLVLAPAFTIAKGFYIKKRPTHVAFFNHFKRFGVAGFGLGALAGLGLTLWEVSQMTRAEVTERCLMERYNFIKLHDDRMSASAVFVGLAFGRIPGLLCLYNIGLLASQLRTWSMHKYAWRRKLRTRNAHEPDLYDGRLN